MINWKPIQKFFQWAKLIFCLDPHTCPPQQMVCLSPSRWQRCGSGIPHGPWPSGIGDLFCQKQEVCGYSRISCNTKAWVSFLNDWWRWSTWWNLVPWLWALRVDGSQLYHWTDKGLPHRMVGGGCTTLRLWAARKPFQRKVTPHC